MSEGFITRARKELHLQVLSSIVRTSAYGIPNFADSSSELSSSIARKMMSAFGGQAGEGIVKPLINVEDLIDKHPELASVLGGSYIIKPDIVISREPEEDETINASEVIVDNLSANRTVLREVNEGGPILHASVSCKWTLRSDRSQNSRTEALNLIRNRKGHLPHIVVVTAEPMPSRIASIALGTGDIDCVYHFALRELEMAIAAIGAEDSAELVENMIRGGRLKDIGDLPLDLAV